MRSSIRISECLFCAGEDADAEEQKAALRQRILQELCRVVKKMRKTYSGQGKLVVHMFPRRFHLYGRLQVFTEAEEGGYRLDLPIESWVVSDRNLAQNEISVMIE